MVVMGIPSLSEWGRTVNVRATVLAVQEKRSIFGRSVSHGIRRHAATDRDNHYGLLRMI
jgi:hypothetical protein